MRRNRGRCEPGGHDGARRSPADHLPLGHHLYLHEGAPDRPAARGGAVPPLRPGLCGPLPAVPPAAPAGRAAAGAVVRGGGPVRRHPLFPAGEHRPDLHAGLQCGGAGVRQSDADRPALPLPPAAGAAAPPLFRGAGRGPGWGGDGVV